MNLSVLVRDVQGFETRVRPSLGAAVERAVVSGAPERLGPSLMRLAKRFDELARPTHALLSECDSPHWMRKTSALVTLKRNEFADPMSSSRPCSVMVAALRRV